jgi:chlorobactene glucosyltransferase
VVVPAHNEEDVIAVLARSLIEQNYTAMHVVFSLDRCTDRTEARLRDVIGDDDRFEIVHASARPEGWAGKTHAVWSGLTQSNAAADADLLLFTDADTIFSPDCIRAAVGLLRARSLDMLSVLSTLTFDRWFERVVQPSAALELMRQNPLLRVNHPDRPKRFANGQFMLFTRDAYEEIDGHQGVSAAILEDLEFARRLNYAGRHVGVFLSDGLLLCRMYRSWRDFVNGWKRIYIESVRQRERRLCSATLRLIGAGFCLPCTALAGLLIGALSIEHWWGIAMLVVGALGLTVWTTTYLLVYSLQRAPIWLVPAAPLGVLAVVSILFAAWRDLVSGRGVTWAGVTYATNTQEPADGSDS